MLRTGGGDVPILHKREQGPGHYLTGSVGGDFTTFRLTPEGEQFLTDILVLKDGDEVRAKDVAFLLERGWAKADEPPPPLVVEPESEVIAPPPKPAPPRRHGPARTPVIRRTRAREIALQVLYQREQNAGTNPVDLDRFIARRLKDEVLQGYARAIVDGVAKHQERIDELISNVAENWRIDRMAAIDRNIIRVGAYEMLFDPEIPPKVAINEALELAKRYSTAQSSRFVNGILDRLQTAEPSDAPPPE